MTSSMSPSSSSSRRMVTAFFDSRSDAEEAIERLATLGYPVTASASCPATSATHRTMPVTAARTESRGLWDSLGDLFLPDEDRGTYAEGLRRGGYLMSVEASDANMSGCSTSSMMRAPSTSTNAPNPGARRAGRAGPPASTDDVLSGSTANLTTGDAATPSGVTTGTAGTASGATSFSDDMAATDPASATSVPPISAESR